MDPLWFREEKGGGGGEEEQTKSGLTKITYKIQSKDKKNQKSNGWRWRWVIKNPKQKTKKKAQTRSHRQANSIRIIFKYSNIHIKSRCRISNTIIFITRSYTVIYWLIKNTLSLIAGRRFIFVNCNKLQSHRFESWRFNLLQKQYGNIHSDSLIPTTYHLSKMITKWLHHVPTGRYTVHHINRLLPNFEFRALESQSIKTLEFCFWVELSPQDHEFVLFFW